MAITKQEHEERLTLYKQGLNDKQIGEHLFLSSSTIRDWRRKNKLPSLVKRGNRTNHDPKTYHYIKRSKGCTK